MSKLDLCRDVQLTEAEGITVVTECHSGWSKGWVAALSTPKSPTVGYEKSFIRESERRVSRAGNGCKFYLGLDDGVYMADSVFRSYSSHRVLFAVLDDQIRVITEEEADRLLGIDRAALKAQAKAEAAAKRAAEEDLIDAASLPALVGSVRQVEWAEGIRRQALSYVASCLAQDQTTFKAYYTKRVPLSDLYSHLRNRTQASWWIDHRTSTRDLDWLWRGLGIDKGEIINF